MYQEAFCTGNSFVVESSMKIDWAYQIVPRFNIKCDSLGNRWLTWIELFYFSFHSADVYMMKKCGNLGIGQVHRNQWNSAVYCTAPKNQTTRKLGKKKKILFQVVVHLVTVFLGVLPVAEGWARHWIPCLGGEILTLASEFGNNRTY